MTAEKKQKAGVKKRLYGREEFQREDTAQFVLFCLGDEQFAVPLSSVKEILAPKEIEEIPFTTDYIAGVLNLRGRIVAVVDLRKKFGFAQAAATRKQRIIIAEYGVQSIGMIVDSVPDVISAPVSSVKPVSSLIAGGIDNDFFSGTVTIDGGVITIIDVEKTLNQGAHRAAQI